MTTSESKIICDLARLVYPILVPGGVGKNSGTRISEFFFDNFGLPGAGAKLVVLEVIGENQCFPGHKRKTPTGRSESFVERIRLRP